MRKNRSIGWRVEHIGNHIRQLFRFEFLEAAGCHGGGAYANTAGDEGLLGIVRYGIFVDGDMRQLQRFGGLLASDILAAQVDQKHVAVRASGDDT